MGHILSLLEAARGLTTVSTKRLASVPVLGSFWGTQQKGSFLQVYLSCLSGRLVGALDLLEFQLGDDSRGH